MLDPLILKALSLGFSALFLLAAVHKLSTPHEFIATLKDYQLLPVPLCPIVAPVLILIEIILALGWLFFFDPLWIALASAAMLSLYTAAIAINVARGRIHIGCGCGITGSSEGDQHLSGGLLIRNSILISLALVAIIPASFRTLNALDYTTLVGVLLATILLYIAANQLLNNGAAIGTWRHSHD